jgi:Protein of unknown function (DUF2591)
MRIKTSELTGAALDWAVAKALYGDRLVHYRTWLETTNAYWKGRDCSFAPVGEYRILSKDFDGVTTAFIKPYSTDWSQGGPIIEREGLLIRPQPGKEAWDAWKHGADEPCYTVGPTPLIAACRCLAASKLGDEVEVPDELAS